MEAEAKLKEQMEMNKSFKKSMETVSKKLQEKESKLAEANEVRAQQFLISPSALGDFEGHMESEQSTLVTTIRTTVYTVINKRMRCVLYSKELTV